MMIKKHYRLRMQDTARLVASVLFWFCDGSLKDKLLSARHLMLILLSVLLAACGPSDDSELRRYMNEVKSRPARGIEPIPEFQHPPTFTYPEEEIRRSPFKPVMPERQADAFAPRLDRPKQPLEAYALDALKFVGVLKDGATTWGLISQPGGLVSRVKRGDYMGKNYGQIISIKDNVIKLEETVQVAGRWEKKIITLKLNTSESGNSQAK